LKTSFPVYKMRQENTTLQLLNVVDVKYGRFFICPEKKLMRGQAFEEFYEGRNVD